MEVTMCRVDGGRTERRKPTSRHSRPLHTNISVTFHVNNRVKILHLYGRWLFAPFTPSSEAVGNDTFNFWRQINWFWVFQLTLYSIIQTETHFAFSLNTLLNYNVQKDQYVFNITRLVEWRKIKWDLACCSATNTKQHSRHLNQD